MKILLLAGSLAIDMLVIPNRLPVGGLFAATFHKALLIQPVGCMLHKPKAF